MTIDYHGPIVIDKATRGVRPTGEDDKPKRKWFPRKPAAPKPDEADTLNLHWRGETRVEREPQAVGATVKACMLVTKRVKAAESNRRLDREIANFHHMRKRPTLVKKASIAQG